MVIRHYNYLDEVFVDEFIRQECKEHILEAPLMNAVNRLIVNPELLNTY